MARPLQFTINELFAMMIVGAIAAWLVSLELTILVPAMLAMVIGIAYRNKSGFPLPLLMFGGAGVGLAVTVSSVITYLLLIQANRVFLGPLSYFGLLGLVICWLITLIIFLQFRKLILGKMPKRTQNPPVQVDELNAS